MTSTRPAWTYPEVGATRTGPLPDGYRHLRKRHRLSDRPCSREDLARLGEQLLTWQVHQAARVRIETSAPVAADDVLVTTRLGWWALGIVEPCAVTWVERSERRVAFGYGTLPTHAFVGEEGFAIERDEAGDLWFTVDVFSNPSLWWVRALGPIVPLFQRYFVARLARGAQRLLRASQG